MQRYRVTQTTYRECWFGSPRQYTYVQQHDIECKQCGVVFHAKWRQLCDACVALNSRLSRKRAKNMRRAAKFGVDAEPYQPLDILERDGWRCHLCGKKIDRRRAWPHPRSPSIDHLIPLAHGGADAPRNVAASHFRCNVRRGTGGEAQLRLLA
jgi:5-methylcytosine-specific restriction endonuclease McrA